ncbi:hypothetical protein D3C87_1531430 [compost metagenome]
MLYILPEFQKKFGTGTGIINYRDHRDDKIKKLSTLIFFENIIADCIDKSNLSFLLYRLIIIYQVVYFPEFYKYSTLPEAVQILKKDNFNRIAFKKI